MRIAVVSDDGKTVSKHFGRASMYVVLTVENEEIVSRETRPKAGHRTFSGGGVGPRAKHDAMVGTVSDCDALIAGGMGSGAVAAFRSENIDPVLTDVVAIDEASLRLASDDLPNLVELLHLGRGEH